MSAFYTNVQRFGNQILYRGYDSAGKAVSRKIKYKPVLYVSTRMETGYKTLFGKRNIEEKELETMADAKRFIEQYSDVDGIDICGTDNYITQYIQREFPGLIKFKMNLINVLAFDIEIDISEDKNIENANKRVNSIVIKTSKRKTYFVLGLRDYDATVNELGLDPDCIHYIQCNSEEQLLKRFIQIWEHENPDVVTGWNVEFFDVRYIVDRIRKVLGESFANRLSPWGRINARTVNNAYGKEETLYEIVGVSVIDYMNIFKKFGYKYGTQDSYKLDHVAHVVLGTRKLSYEEYGDLTTLYEKNHQKYIDYNILDTKLIHDMEEETGLIALTLSVAYKGGVNYTDALGTTGIWEATLYRKLCEKKLMPPVARENGRDADLLGGHVKDPRVGMSHWVCSFDLNSLYPHLMLQYNMSPETFLPDMGADISQEMVLEKKFRLTSDEYTVCPNGACFTKKQLGVIPEIIEGYYAERSNVKKEMLRKEQEYEDAKTGDDESLKRELKRQIANLHNQQMAIKILMNSLYGALGNKYFKYYVNKIAGAITSSGQLSIKWVEQAVNEYLNKIMKTDNFDYVIYSDTDSIYVDMAPLVESVFGTVDIPLDKGEEFLDKVCKTKIEKVIEECYEELAERVSAYRNAMKMKREKIANKAVFVSKKRYVQNVLNSEDVHYDEPKISITGLEAVRSSTPEICRDKLKEVFSIIMKYDEARLQDFIADFREDFYKMDPETIGRNSGVNDIQKYLNGMDYVKGTPMHVRGAILYNKYLVEHGLDRKYDTVQSGDKIKLIYLTEPNVLRENVIAFPGILPREIPVLDNIDYKTQFQKVFLKPLEGIMDSIGWSAEKKATLTQFFM